MDVLHQDSNHVHKVLRGHEVFLDTDWKKIDVQKLKARTIKLSLRIQPSPVGWQRLNPPKEKGFNPSSITPGVVSYFTNLTMREHISRDGLHAVLIEPELYQDLPKEQFTPVYLDPANNQLKCKRQTSNYILWICIALCTTSPKCVARIKEAV